MQEAPRRARAEGTAGVEAPRRCKSHECHESHMVFRGGFPTAGPSPLPRSDNIEPFAGAIASLLSLPSSFVGAAALRAGGAKARGGREGAAEVMKFTKFTVSPLSPRESAGPAVRLGAGRRVRFDELRTGPSTELGTGMGGLLESRPTGQLMTQEGGCRKMVVRGLCRAQRRRRRSRRRSRA